MNQRILRFVQKAVLFVAMLSVATPSQATFYEPEVPEKLKHFKL